MADPVSKREFADLYAATVRDILSYLRRRTDRDVEDLAGEVYVIAWRKRTAMPEADMRRAWLFGVARNLLRADRRQRDRDDTAIQDLTTHPGTRPERSAGATEDIVAEALARLSPDHREVLRLTAWEGLTPAELAVALSVRPGTARVRLHRARQALAADPQIRDLVDRRMQVLAAEAPD